jgi:hypothetical protein
VASEVATEPVLDHRDHARSSGAAFADSAAMMPRILSLLFLATSLAACVADDQTTGEASGGGGKADGQTPVIVFDLDWNETKTGRLLAGDRMQIQYDLDRLTQCRGRTNGSDVWGVTGYASFDGRTPVTFALSRIDAGGNVQPVLATVDIPANTTDVAMWFSINNRWGCIAYDSNENRNYMFDIEGGASGAVLSFNADWNEVQSAAIRPGDTIVVHYEPERLAQCASSRAGNATWSVTAFWRVDGGTTKSLTVTRSEGSSLVAADPTITVPRGGDLEMWFQATNISGCNAYDSNLDANYHFAIE